VQIQLGTEEKIKYKSGLKKADATVKQRSNKDILSAELLRIARSE
jgi:hypothetical protein